MHQSVADAFFPFSTQLEGRVPFMYLDVKSLVSTGIGNLLDADDPAHIGSHPVPLADTFTAGWFDKDSGAVASTQEITDEWNHVKFSGTALRPLRPDKEAITRLRISDASIDTLVRGKLSSFETTLRGRAPFALLDSWPADAQLGLFSMAWGLGPLFHFPKFQAAAAIQDWETMAAECRMTETGNPGVIPRNVRNQILFTIAWWMAAPPPGEFSALVYDPTLSANNPAQSLADNMRANTFPIPIKLDIGLQTALERLAVDLSRPAYDPNGLDGVFGPGTRNAITAFQRDHGLSQTPSASHIADVGQGTVNALIAELDALQISHWP